MWGEDLLDDELADERRVVATTFPDASSRPAWLLVLGDLVTILEELRAAVEGAVLLVLPFLHGDDTPPQDLGEDIWSSDELADSQLVELSIEPDDD